VEPASLKESTVAESVLTDSAPQETQENEKKNREMEQMLNNGSKGTIQY
jgi:hypothetical protein